MCSFGDFAALSDVVDVSTARIMKVEVCDGIIAPGFEPEALEILKAKKKGAFIIMEADPTFVAPLLEYREVYGAAFCQRRNDTLITTESLDKVICGDPNGFSADAKRDLILASIAVKYTQSNSVGYAKNGMMIGVGAGQQSRVDCVKLAGRKVAVWWMRQHPKVQGLRFKSSVGRQARVNARVRYIEGDITTAEKPGWEENFEEVPNPLTAEDKAEFLASLSGVTVSSDAFFPFRDSIDHASKYGVSFIAQPGGSVADDEIIAACKEYGMTMAFTNIRLFHH
jgi:phosphoribosylaminoimidazolecarboxamide formyltransferase / IMP cyclohydrolase